MTVSVRMSGHRSNFFIIFLSFFFQLIDEIIKKHKAVQPTEGEKRSRRKKYEEEQREVRRRRRRRVVATKLRNKRKKAKVPKPAPCPECGELHVKKSDTCKVI